jgi:hypothetical protein
MGGFLRVLQFPPPIKLTEILLKVVLNRVPGENHPSVAIHRQTLPHKVVHLTIMVTTAQTTIGPSILDLVSKDEIPYFILSLKIIGFDGINNLFMSLQFCYNKHSPLCPRI